MIDNVDSLSFFKGYELKLTDNVFVKHPKLSDIEYIGEEKYSEYFSCLSAISLDVADILWFELKVWYEDIKNEWDFFIQKCLSGSKEIIVRIKEKDMQMFRVEDKCLAIGSSYRDALNFFLGLSGEYVILERKQKDLSQKIIYNVAPVSKNEKLICYEITEDSFKFTEHFYKITKEFLDLINGSKREYDFMKGAIKMAKTMMLKEKYNQRKSKRKNNVNLNSIVSSLIAKGVNYKDIWDYPIYVIYDIYYRHLKIYEYSNTTNALYNGCFDEKSRNKLDWDKINWSSIIH